MKDGRCGREKNNPIILKFNELIPSILDEAKGRFEDIHFTKVDNVLNATDISDDGMESILIFRVSSK